MALIDNNMPEDYSKDCVPFDRAFKQCFKCVYMHFPDINRIVTIINNFIELHLLSLSEQFTFYQNQVVFKI